MGVYLEYNSFTGKWEWRGFGFRWQYATKEAAEKDRRKAIEEHMNRLKANQLCQCLLVGLRYRQKKEVTMNNAIKENIKKQNQLIQQRLEKAAYDKVSKGNWPFDGIEYATAPLWWQLDHLELCRSYIRNQDWDEDPSWEKYDDACTLAMRHVRRLMASAE